MDTIEYSIYCIWNGGAPFYLKSYNNIFQAKQDLYEMIELEKERNRIYYVDNDFYENEYPCSIRCKIFSIRERKVSKWCKYSEKENHIRKEKNIFYINS